MKHYANESEYLFDTPMAFAGSRDVIVNKDGSYDVYDYGEPTATENYHDDDDYYRGIGFGRFDD